MQHGTQHIDLFTFEPGGHFFFDADQYFVGSRQHLLPSFCQFASPDAPVSGVWISTQQSHFFQIRNDSLHALGGDKRRTCERGVGYAWLKLHCRKDVVLGRCKTERAELLIHARPEGVLSSLEHVAQPMRHGVFCSLAFWHLFPLDISGSLYHDIRVMTLHSTTGNTAKVIGPSFIALQVRDLEASKTFYMDRLGLTAAAQSPPDAVVFNTEPTPFGIRKPLVDLNATRLLGWGVSLWIAASDADALHARFVDAGVPIVLPPADGPFGRFFAFRDPDGYTITVSTAQPKSATSTLDLKDCYLTFINTFTVEPDKADCLLEDLKNATEKLFRHQPGFISANLHMSRDRRKVVNYAQWRSKEDYVAMSQLPDVQSHMKQAAALANGFDPVDYDLREVVAGNGA